MFRLEVKLLEKKATHLEEKPFSVKSQLTNMDFIYFIRHVCDLLISGK